MKQIFDYIESLKITQGAHVGESFTLLPWEKRFLRGALAEGVSTAALSIGRGNRKEYSRSSTSDMRY